MDIRRAQSTAGGVLPADFDAWSAMGGRDSETGGHDNVSGYGSRRAEPSFGENDVQRVESMEEENKRTAKAPDSDLSRDPVKKTRPASDAH